MTCLVQLPASGPVWLSVGGGDIILVFVLSGLRNADGLGGWEELAVAENKVNQDWPSGDVG